MGTNTTLYREILKAKKSKKPLIIVEGDDDPKFYGNILIHGLHIQSEELDGTCTIRSIRDITTTQGKLGTPGCIEIIRQFTDIQQRFIDDSSLEKYCVGIIDRDAFYYIADPVKINKRNSLKGIFTLKYYSFESYGLTKENIRYVISKNTNLRLSEVNDALLECIWEELECNVFEDLKYVGLDCLKHALDDSYSNKFAYKEDAEFLRIQNIKNRVRELNKSSLDEFEDSLSNCGYDTELRKIVKGKQLLKSCASHLAFVIKNQEKCCKQTLTACAILQDCVMVKSGDKPFDNVSCKLKPLFSKLSDDVTIRIYNDLIYKIDLKEVEDIIEKFKQLNINIA